MLYKRVVFSGGTGHSGDHTLKIATAWGAPRIYIRQEAVRFFTLLGRKRAVSKIETWSEKSKFS